MGAEDPLFILYTSGSTGKPKGVLHTTGGYLVYAAMTHKYVFDYQDGRRLLLRRRYRLDHRPQLHHLRPPANGATTVMFESCPPTRTPGRYWQIVDDLGVNIFYTAPTAIRALIRPRATTTSRSTPASLRILGTVGEPINPEAWRWYHDVVGDGSLRHRRHLVADRDRRHPDHAAARRHADLKPGSATLPFFGVKPLWWIDEDGKRDRGQRRLGQPLPRNQSWPGQARTVYGDHERFHETYFSRFPGSTSPATAAAATRTATTGSPVGWTTSSTCRAIAWAPPRSRAHWSPTRSVAEAAVVGFPHDIKGQGIFAYVILTAEFESVPHQNSSARSRSRCVTSSARSPPPMRS
jgi:acetyl-CoA synthetase